MTHEITHEILLWGSVVFVAIFLSNSNVNDTLVLFIVLCFCLGTKN